VTPRAEPPKDVMRRLRVVPEAAGRTGPRFTLTDLGNAERFVDQHGERVRFCHPWGKWFIFDGRRWVTDDSGLVEAMMKTTVRHIYNEAAEAETDKERKAIADHAKRSESRARIADALHLTRSETGIPVSPAEFDSDPWLLNCENGTVDLRTGELREHRRADLITKLVPVEYDPQAAAPVFMAFLEQILPSEALRRFVQRVVGYAATGRVSEEILVILHGGGANGKSTLVNAVMETLGDYAQQTAPDLLLVKRGAHPTELADLFGARLVASVEVDEGRRLAESLVKQLTGRDPIKARRMREDFWQFDPTHTVFLATNHRPEVRGTDHAIWRRLRLVPFNVTIPKPQQDRALAEKLRAELPGVLRWIVAGCLEWQREGLGEPDEVKAATGQYREDMDILGDFIAVRCVVHPNVSAGATPLYNAYKGWCEENGENAVPQRRFGLQLGERGFEKDKVGTVVWRGIGLRHDGDDGGGPYGQQGPEGESRKDKPQNSPNVDTPGPYGPQNGINNNFSLHEASMSKKGPQGPQGPQGPETTHSFRLTAEQVERAQRLIEQGVSPKLARAEVLGEDGAL
jgi:putative DNA primase/helicase